MKRNLFTLFIAFTLIFVLSVPVFAGTKGMKTDHWSQKYIDELSLKHDISPIFNGKNLNAFITAEDFQKAIRLL